MKDERSLVNLCYDIVELDPDAPENKEFIEKTMAAFGEKVESYIKVDRIIDAQASLLEKEMEDLEGKIKALKKFKKLCRDRAAFVMQAMKKHKIAGPNGYAMHLNYNESVDVTNAELLPDWAKEKKVTYTPKKLEIKEYLRQGKKLEGATLRENATVSYRCTAKDLINSTLRGLTDLEANSSTLSMNFSSSEKEPVK